jgi:hypothetical protein
MEKTFWQQKLQWFVVEHPFFDANEESIFTPKEGLIISFWFEGNLQVEGKYGEFEINYNSSDMLVLAVGKPFEKGRHIFRIPWNRLISFELKDDNSSTEEITNLLRINPFHNN